MPVKTNAVDYTGLFDGRPQPERYEQPKQDSELAQEIDSWVDLVERYRGQFEASWRVNHSFVRGDQLLGRHKITGDIVRLSVEDSKRLRVKHNILAPAARILIGKLSATTPTFSVQPATADFEERQGGIAAESILQFVREQLDLDQKYEYANTYLPDMGNGFLYLIWDPMGGRRISSCDVCGYLTYDLETLGTPCPNCTMQKQAEQQIAQIRGQTMMTQTAGAVLAQEQQSDITPQELMQGQESPSLPVQQLGPLPPEAEVPMLQEAKEGDSCVKVLSPFDVYITPGITETKKATRWAVREPIEVSQACAEYPDFAQFFTAENDVERELSKRTAMVTGLFSSAATMELNDHLYRWTVYEGPTEEYPTGRMIVKINGFIVKEEENPYYDFGRPNIYHFGFDRIKGELYFEAPVTHAWERQREYNLMQTQAREAIDLTLRRKMLVPIGSGITVDELRSDTQQIISFNAAAGPPIIDWKGPELPQSFWMRRNELEQDIQKQLCITDADIGMLGSDPNGRALAIATAEADKTLGPIIRRNNAEYRDMHFGILLLYQKFAHEDRMAAIPGEQGCAIVYFKDLKLLKPGFRLMLHEEDGLSRNPAVRLQQTLTLFQATGGAYFIDKATGQFDKKAFATQAKLRLQDQGADKQATEQAAAAKVPLMIQRGEQWQPRMFDIPDIWADTLEDWLRGPGRNVDQQLSQQVEQVWMYYKQWAVTGAPPGQGQPGQGPSRPGQETSAPGGSPNAIPGSEGSTTAMGEAQQTVRGADRAGEAAARQAPKQES